MERKDLITIIIPVYQSEKWLHKCLTSIIGQSYEYFEVILIDDGSTDKSNVICDMYSKKDSRIRVVHQENKGASAARNLGIKLALGKYIYFVDSDDWLHENCLRSLIEEIDEESNIFIFNYNLVDEERCYSNFKNTEKIELINRENIIKSMLKISEKENYCEGYLWNKLFLREIIVKNNIMFNSSFIMWEDMLFCYKYSLYVTKGVYIHSNLYYHRRNKDSLSYYLNVYKMNSWYNAAKDLYENIKKYDINILDSYKGILANICMNNLVIYSLNNNLNNCKDYDEKINFIIQGRNGLRFKYKLYFLFLRISKYLFCSISKIFKY